MNEAALNHLVILLLAVLLDQVWRWPLPRHPITAFRILAEAMARKVRPKSTDSPRQHMISGALGAALLVLPWVILIFFFLQLAAYPAFFEALILIILVDFAHVRRRYFAVMLALKKGNYLLAKQLLRPLVARDTYPLSEIGIAKAAVESLLLRFHYQYAATLMWFALVGPVAALCYRLVLTINWQWHTKRKGFREFVKPVRRLSQWLNTPTLLLSALMLAFCSQPKLAWHALRTCPVRDRTSLLLTLFATPMQILLGGPARYRGKMYRYTRVGVDNDINFQHMQTALMLIQRASVLLVSFLLLGLLFAWRFGTP